VTSSQFHVQPNTQLLTLLTKTGCSHRGFSGVFDDSICSFIACTSPYLNCRHYRHKLDQPHTMPFAKEFTCSPEMFDPAHIQRIRIADITYFLGFRLILIALQAQRRDSGMPRGVTYIHESQSSQRKQVRSSLNAATTGVKSFLPKLAHSL
jgi:hypothetical protein